MSNRMYTNSKEPLLVFNINEYVELTEGKNRNKINRTKKTKKNRSKK